MEDADHEKILHSFYKWQVTIFRLVAAWKLPETATYRRRILYHVHYLYLMCAWKLLFDLTLLIQFILKISDLNEVIKVFFIFATVSGVLVKYTTVKVKNSTYHDLVNSLHRPMFRPRNEREVQLLKQAEKTSLGVRNSYGFISLCALNAVLLTQFMVDPTELPLASYIPFSLSAKWRYNLVYLWQYFAVSICCSINIAFDSITPSFLIFIKGQLDILCDRLENLGKKRENDEIINKQLKDCCAYYEEILKLARTVEYLVSLPVSIQIICSVLVLVANFYALTFLYEPTDYANSAKVIIYQICMLAQIFILCNFANEVTLKSEQISHALYKSEWFAWDKYNRKLFLIMTMRFDTPILIRSINPTYSFSLAAFTSIVNSSYSYFALLKNFNK